MLPAVDVVDGQAVRLVQGEAGTETGYGDPLEAARAWAADGAEWLHLVDLDAAFRRGSNAALLATVIDRIDIKVELSGGIRDDASLRRALDTGCARVNIGTAALEDPAWCAQAIAEFGDRVAVGLDVKIADGRHRLAARGWVSRRRRPLERARPPRRRGLRALRRHRRRPGRHADRARTPSCSRPSAPAPTGRWWPRAGWRASTTCGRSPRWPRSGSRAPSSARPCTRGRSPSPRPCTP